MLCKRCGAYIQPGTRYCPNCGIEIGGMGVGGTAPSVSNNTGNALLLEIILSLFGIFGVGWLLAGETTMGIILLVCSIFVYWPFMIFGTLLTFGLGLICLGPLAITAIIVNAVVFNTILQRKRPQQTLPPLPPLTMY